VAPTVLVITSLEDVTADMVIAPLRARGAEVTRVDPADIGPELVFGAVIGNPAPSWSGRLRTPSREVDLGGVEAVYYRRPSPWRFAHLDHLGEQTRAFAAAEAKHGLGGLLTNLPGARYANHPAAVTRADFKPAQLQAAAGLGLTVPPTLVTNDVEQARKFAADYGPVVYKTFRGVPASPDGYTGAIWTQRIDPETLDDALAVTAHLFQAEVPKTADARITVVGRRVFAEKITTSDASLDWRRGDWDALSLTPIKVPPGITTALHAYLDAFGLVFGCFDFALREDADKDSDRFTFIECNSNGQWGFLSEADRIADAFADVLLEG
jgi:ATP-grasp ribosomal peptide maturase